MRDRYRLDPPHYWLTRETSMSTNQFDPSHGVDADASPGDGGKRGSPSDGPTGYSPEKSRPRSDSNSPETSPLTRGVLFSSDGSADGAIDLSASTGQPGLPSTSTAQTATSMAAAGIGDVAVDAGPVVGASAGIVNNNSVALAEVASAANAAALAANQAAKEAARASDLVQSLMFLVPNQGEPPPLPEQDERLRGFFSIIDDKDPRTMRVLVEWFPTFNDMEALAIHRESNVVSARISAFTTVAAIRLYSVLDFVANGGKWHAGLSHRDGLVFPGYFNISGCFDANASMDRLCAASCCCGTSADNPA